MATLKFEKEITALVVIDPYNDFISEEGKVWDRIKKVAQANDCVPHMLRVLEASRKPGVTEFVIHPGFDDEELRAATEGGQPGARPEGRAIRFFRQPSISRDSGSREHQADHRAGTCQNGVAEMSVVGDRS